MRKYKFFSHIFLLLHTPFLIAYPQHSLPKASIEYKHQETKEWSATR